MHCSLYNLGGLFFLLVGGRHVTSDFDRSTAVLSGTPAPGDAVGEKGERDRIELLANESPRAMTLLRL